MGFPRGEVGAQLAGRAAPDDAAVGQDGHGVGAADREVVVLLDEEDREPGLASAIEHFTTAIEAYRDREPSSDLVEALTGRSVDLVNTGDVPGAAQDARRALAIARELAGDGGQARYATQTPGTATFLKTWGLAMVLSG